MFCSTNWTMRDNNADAHLKLVFCPQFSLFCAYRYLLVDLKVEILWNVAFCNHSEDRGTLFTNTFCSFKVMYCIFPHPYAHVSGTALWMTMVASWSTPVVQYFTIFTTSWNYLDLCNYGCVFSTIQSVSQSFLAVTNVKTFHPNKVPWCQQKGRDFASLF